LQVFGPQNPLEHKLSQQSLGPLHATPCGLHSMPPQKPCKQSKLQHCLSVVHARPVGVQATPPQNPLVQSRLQQSTVVVQAAPCGTQICSGLQRPSLQSKSVQQVSLAEHGSPSLPHTGFEFPNRSYSPVREPHEANVSTRIVTSAHADAMRALSEGRIDAV
jgi:hypothetical protein